MSTTQAQRAPATNQPLDPAYAEWLAECERVTMEGVARYRERQEAKRVARGVGRTNTVEVT